MFRKMTREKSDTEKRIEALQNKRSYESERLMWRAMQLAKRIVRHTELETKEKAVMSVDKKTLSEFLFCVGDCQDLMDHLHHEYVISNAMSDYR